MKIKSGITAILLLTALLLSGCKKNSQKITEKKSEYIPPRKITIGFSIDTLAIERWQRDLDIFINKVKELGADVIVQNAGNSVEEQKRQLIYLMERNVDVVVVVPKDATSITEPVQKIRSKNIPVISYDRLTLNTDIDLYVTINTEKVGEQMAIGLLQQTKGKNWYLILGPEEDYNMTFIKQGVNKILRNTNVNISHIFYTDGWNYDLSYQEMTRLLANDEIPDAIICGNDAVATSVIQAINRYHPDSHIPICGQDADIAACQNIVKGIQDFTIYKPIAKLAELAAEYAVYMAKKEDIYEKSYPIKTINNGKSDIPVIWLDPVMVNKNNLDSVIISSGFHTANSVYGAE